MGNVTNVEYGATSAFMSTSIWEQASLKMLVFVIFASNIVKTSETYGRKILNNVWSVQRPNTGQIIQQAGNFFIFLFNNLWYGPNQTLDMFYLGSNFTILHCQKAAKKLSNSLRFRRVTYAARQTEACDVFMSPVSPVFHTVVTVCIGLKT